MSVDAIQQSTNPSKSQIAQDKLNSDYNNFLLLLTTQLQNQDPTEPLDTNQLTQQIASLSTVEQQINTNQNLEKLIELNNSNQINNAVNYIGKYVETEGNTGVLEEGYAYFVYKLPEGARTANVTITDATGKAVFEGSGIANSGRNLVVWDGVSSFTGEDMPPGDYKINVRAKDGAGKDIIADTLTVGRVTSVDLENGAMNLTVGDQSIPLSDILSISDQPHS